MTTAQERIAIANRLADETFGYSTTHCLTCGQLECEGHEPTVPAQRTGAHDEQVSA